MNEFKELPEYIEAEKAYVKVENAIKDYNNYKEKTIVGVANALTKLSKQLKIAEEAADRLGREVANEEIHNGKSSQKTVEKYDQAINEVTRIKKTFDSISDSSGIAIYELGKKKNNLLQKLHEEKQNGDAIYKTILARKSLITRNKMKAMHKSSLDKQREIEDEINEIDSLITIINSNSKNKKLNADSGLVETAQTVLNESVNAYKTRYNVSERIRSKVENNKKEMDRLKAENGCLEIALACSQADALADLLYEAEIDIILWPELYEKRCFGYDTKHQILFKIKNKKLNDSLI